MRWKMAKYKITFTQGDIINKIVYVEADSSTYALIKFLCENQGISDYKAVEEVAE